MWNKVVKVMTLAVVPVALLVVFNFVVNARRYARRPVAVSIGTLKDKDVERLGLRALSAQLKLHPQATQVKVMWRSSSSHKPADAGFMLFNRPGDLLNFVPGSNQHFRFHSRGCSIDESTVHQWAKQGAIEGFCSTAPLSG